MIVRCAWPAEPYAENILFEFVARMRILSIGTLDESVHHDSRAWMIEDIALVQATATIIMQGQPFPCFPSPVIDQI
jgi:hypothetical protein